MHSPPALNHAAQEMILFRGLLGDEGHEGRHPHSPRDVLWLTQQKLRYEPLSEHPFVCCTSFLFLLVFCSTSHTTANSRPACVSSASQQAQGLAMRALAK